MGIKKVRFRPHPSEDSQWYLRFIDKDFFIPDVSNLTDCLKSSSLVIGPTTTVFLESIYQGINYVIFEPSKNDYDVLDTPLVHPFTGSDKRIPVAKKVEELESMISNKIKVDASFFNDYIKTPFNIDFVKDLI
jgi:hypothetical protein